MKHLLRVIPHSSRNELIPEEGIWKVYLKAVPEKDKANKALIKFLKDEYSLHVRLISENIPHCCCA